MNEAVAADIAPHDGPQNEPYAGPTVLSVGDSHAFFWCGQDKHGGKPLIPGFSVASVGPALAYNLTRNGTKVAGLERLTLVMDRAQKRGELTDYVLFNFGEIDIRAHVVGRAIRAGISLEDGVNAVCDNYLQCLRNFRRYGRDILVFGPPASQMDGATHNPNMPVVGSEIERNAATAMFHARMQAEQGPGFFRFISVLPHLLLPSGRTNRSVLYDKTHLGQIAMPYALDAFEAVAGWRPAWTPPHGMVPQVLAPSPMPAVPGVRTAAAREDIVTLTGAMSGLDGGQTGHRNVALFKLDIGALRFFEEIRLHFATEEEASDLDGLPVNLTCSLVDYAAVDSYPGAAISVSGNCRVIRMPPTMARAISVGGRNSSRRFSLASVEIYARCFDWVTSRSSQTAVDWNLNHA